MSDSDSEHDAQSDFLRELRYRLCGASTDVRFLSACAQYLTGIEQTNRELRVELSLQRDELEYVRAKWRSAEEHIVELEDRLQRTQFEQQLRSDAADARAAAGPENAERPPDNELQFGNGLDAYVFGSVHEDAASTASSEPLAVDDDLHAIVPPPANHHHTRAVLVTDYFARRLHDGGDFALAAPVCRHIIANTETDDAGCAEAARNGRLLAAAHELLAMHERAHQQTAAAAVQLQRAVDIFERTLPADDPTLSTTLNNLSLLYLNCGQLDRARQCGARALQLRCARYGGRLHRSVARQHHNMAIIERGRRDHARVLVHLAEAERVYTGARHAPDPEDPQPADDARVVRGWVRTCREQMCELYGQAGRWPEAAGVLKRWLEELVPRAAGGGRPAIWERAEEAERSGETVGGDVYGRWCERLAESVRAEAMSVLRQLAAVYRSMGMRRAAEVLDGAPAAQEMRVRAERVKCERKTVKTAVGAGESRVERSRRTSAQAMAAVQRAVGDINRGTAELMGK